jgi:periplasmic divalent cation tolerance protein
MEITTKFRLVFVTTDSIENAKNMAKILVSERLAACCSVISNVTSVFGWHNSIQETHEYVLMIKTSEDKLDVLESRISELHSYEVPEIIATHITEGSLPYLKWMSDSLND